MGETKLVDSVYKEFRNAKQIVEYLLENFPRARNSDTFLIFKYLEYKGLDIEIKDDQIIWRIPMDDFSLLPSFETPRRVRQEIQNKENRFLPTIPSVIHKRKIKEKAVRAYYGGESQTFRIYQSMIKLKY